MRRPSAARANMQDVPEPSRQAWIAKHASVSCCAAQGTRLLAARCCIASAIAGSVTTFLLDACIGNCRRGQCRAAGLSWHSLKSASLKSEPLALVPRTECQAVVLAARPVAALARRRRRCRLPPPPCCAELCRPRHGSQHRGSQDNYAGGVPGAHERQGLLAGD